MISLSAMTAKLHGSSHQKFSTMTSSLGSNTGVGARVVDGGLDPRVEDATAADGRCWSPESQDVPMRAAAARPSAYDRRLTVASIAQVAAPFQHRN